MKKVLASTLAAAGLGLALVSGTTAHAAAAPDAARQATGGCHRTLASYPVLHAGDRGKAVRTLQCLLNDDGFGPVTVDGIYGEETKAAILDLESGFEGTPEHPFRIGGGMWTLMIAARMPDRLLEQGDSGHAVVLLQRALRAGRGELAVDGDFGPQTKAAVKAFQRHNGVKATGKVNARTRFWLKMGAVTRGRI
ncbi:MAG: peptidoglycan-binding protein [Nocardioidaceae bacterium]